MADHVKLNMEQANRGIGLGIAEVCLANSAKTVYSLDLLDPSEDFAVLKKKYANLKYIQMDVTDESSVEKALDQIVSEEGVINGLVANAGMTKHQPALDFSREQIEQLFNLNVSLDLKHQEFALNKKSHPVTGFRGLFLCPDCCTQVHLPRHQRQHCLYRIHDIVPAKPCRSKRSLWRYQGSCPKYGAHTGHGVGQTWYQSELDLSWLCEDGDDLLCGDRARLGSQDAVLWRYA